MPELPDLTDTRRHALHVAADLHTNRYANPDQPGALADKELRATATMIADWLTGPAFLMVTIGDVTDQTTGQPTGHTIEGTPMQLRETDQVDLTVTVASVKGTPIPDDPATTGDDLTWTTDNPDVADLHISPDTRTCTVVAGLVGSTVVTVSLRDLTATLAVDVIPGDAALLTITEGTPTEQATEPEPTPEEPV